MVSDYEVVEQIGDTAVIKKFSPSIGYSIVKFGIDGSILEEKQIQELREEELRIYNENSLENGFVLSGILIELYPDYKDKNGYGVVDNNGILSGFWFKKESKDMVDALAQSIGNYVILKGYYNINNENFNPKLPVFNYVDDVVCK